MTPQDCAVPFTLRGYPEDIGPRVTARRTLGARWHLDEPGSRRRHRRQGGRLPHLPGQPAAGAGAGAVSSCPVLSPLNMLAGPFHSVAKM
jgi:hypothetical protein